MNSNKNSYYKNSLYTLITSGIIIVCSLIVGLIFGVNYATSVEPGKLLIACVCSVLISTLAIFLFVGFLTSFAKAFGIVLLICHNVLLSTALIILVRIPVSDTLVMGYILLVSITTAFALLSTRNYEKLDLKKEDIGQLIKSSINNSIKLVLSTSVMTVAVLLLCMIVASESMLNLVREFLVMEIVIVISYLLLQHPVICYVSTIIKRNRKPKIDKNVENQKIVKAVVTEETEQLQDGAKIEQNNSEEE